MHDRKTGQTTKAIKATFFRCHRLTIIKANIHSKLPISASY